MKSCSNIEARFSTKGSFSFLVDEMACIMCKMNGTVLQMCTGKEEWFFELDCDGKWA